jgi:hypothetical protein
VVLLPGRPGALGCIGRLDALSIMRQLCSLLLMRSRSAKIWEKVGLQATQQQQDST